MYVEIMMIKDALRPYQQQLIELQHRDINIPNLRKSKDFYRIYTQNPYHGANEEPKLYVEKYCENEQDLYTLAFTKKVKLEKEVKLKEFNFKLLHGILPCNRNLKKRNFGGTISVMCAPCLNLLSIYYLSADMLNLYGN